MIYFKRFFLLLLLSFALSACQNEKEDDDDEKSMHLNRAQTAFAEGDYETSVQLLLPLAFHGDPDAQYALGYAFYEGLGVPQDRMQAYFWIQESAMQGNSHALLALEIFEVDPNLPMDEVGVD